MINDDKNAVNRNHQLNKNIATKSDPYCKLSMNESWQDKKYYEEWSDLRDRIKHKSVFHHIRNSKQITPGRCWDVNG